jgi:hypothetical protein
MNARRMRARGACHRPQRARHFRRGIDVKIVLVNAAPRREDAMSRTGFIGSPALKTRIGDLGRQPAHGARPVFRLRACR